MNTMRFTKGLSLIGVITSVAMITGFLGTYFLMQQQIEKQTNEDDKAVRGQLLVSEVLEIVQGIKTANVLQCRKERDEFFNGTGPDPTNTSVCKDWDKGFLSIDDDSDPSGPNEEKRAVLDSKTGLKNPNSGSAIEIKSTDCEETNSNPAGTGCNVKRTPSDGYYAAALSGVAERPGGPSGGENTDFRRFVKFEDIGEDKLQATSYVFLRNRNGTSYGDPDGSANFASAIRLSTTDLAQPSP